MSTLPFYAGMRLSPCLLLISACASGGEFVLDLRLDRPTGVVRIDVDGAYNQDLYVFAGVTGYRVLTGPLDAPPSRVTADDSVIDFTVHEAPAWAAYAPLLYSRPGAGLSDAPMLAYVERDGPNAYTFSMIWSNEDGGTGLLPALMMARFGRVTDIEWVYRVEIESGRVVAERFHGLNHESTPFTGEKLGLHPILTVKSANNNMVAGARSDRRTMLLPVEWTGDGPRERLMDEHPWTYRASHDEMRRENKLSDLRRWAIVEARVETDGPWRVGLHAAGEWFWSGRQSGPGWTRTAVELPEGALPDDAVIDGRVAASRVLMLDRDFVPRELDLRVR